MVLWVQPPGRDVVLYDGRCALCVRSVDLLRRLVPPDASIEYRSFREPGALAPFPGIGPEQCEHAVQLIRSNGQVFGGMEAIVRVLRSRPGLTGRLAAAYRLPGLRRLLDLVYDAVARNRFRLGSLLVGSAEVCEGGTCRWGTLEEPHPPP